MEYIEAIQDSIQTGYGSKAIHFKTVSVDLKHDGETIWQGEVEVFELSGHSEAKYAYGWGFEEGNKTHFATVLGVRPIDNPESAVKAYLVNQSKNK